MTVNEKLLATKLNLVCQTHEKEIIMSSPILFQSLIECMNDAAYNKANEIRLAIMKEIEEKQDSDRRHGTTGYELHITGLKKALQIIETIKIK